MRWYITSGKDGRFWSCGAWRLYPAGLSDGFATSEEAWAAAPTVRKSGHRRSQLTMAKYADDVISTYARPEGGQ